MINESVGSCEVLIAVIGKQWLTSTDEEGRRRLDDPDDFIRLEISAALDRDVRVIAALVWGAVMPKTDLPAPLENLLRRQGIEISDGRFHQDVDRLIEAIEEVIGRQEASAVRSSTGFWDFIKRRAPMLGLGLAQFVVLFAAYYLYFQPPKTVVQLPASPPLLPSIEKPVTRFEIPLNEGRRFTRFHRHRLALSPDGSRLVFVSSGSETSELQVRALDQLKAIPLTNRVEQPFFSPDGKWLGGVAYSEDRSVPKLKKFPLDGGPPTTICDCRIPYGASWGSDDTIAFVCAAQSGLWRVSASGREPEQITELDKDTGEVSHRLPHMLPGGRAVLFTVLRYQTIGLDWEKAQIVVQLRRA